MAKYPPTSTNPKKTLEKYLGQLAYNHHRTRACNIILTLKDTSSEVMEGRSIPMSANDELSNDHYKKLFGVRYC